MSSGTFLDYLVEIRMQLACFIILQFIVWTFFSAGRKRSYDNELFSGLIGVTIFTLALDMLCVYILNYADGAQGKFVYALCEAFIISSVMILYLTYLYIKSITIKRPPKIAEAVPVLLSALCAIFLPLHLEQTRYGVVFSGEAKSVAYMSAASYFFVCLLLLAYYWKTIEKKARRSIITALASLLIVTVVQTVQSELAISGIGYTVIVMALFYSLESPDAEIIEKLAYERNRANDATRAKSAFLANMSHEIRTPINAILGMDEMILRESSERETLSYASDIQAAGKTLLSLINDILDFSKVEEGKMEILPTQYDLRSVVNDLVNMVRDRADKKGLRLKIELDESTPHLLYGDAIRIRQCSLNLLTNAVKYTESGSVTLALGYEQTGEDSISLRIRVSDTGIGMKPEDVERMFSPFTRIEEQRNRSIEGTGLGMSITKQLIELMGSTLEVESVYGEGSTFSFAIEQGVVKWEPVGAFSSRSEEVHRSAYRELFHAPGARVLAVDDTPVNLTVVRALLKKTQIVIDTAESGREALELAANQYYDIFLIDHMMPEMDGIETLHELQKLPHLKTSVFIALTANAVSGARELYIEAGFDDYLSKPVDGEHLEDMLVHYLPPEKLSAPTAEEASGGAKPGVLIADDDRDIRRFVSETLADDYRVVACANAAEVLSEAERSHPSLIYLSVRLDGASGFEVLQSLKRNAATCDIPVVLLTDEENADVETLGLRNGAADFLRKDYLPDVVMRRTRRVIHQARMQADLQNEVKNQILRTERLSKEMMLTLSKAVDAKDHFTNGHSERVAEYSAEIARRLGKSLQEQEQIYEAALLHDVGKIGVNEELINKVGDLTEDEFAAIRRHTVVGCEILGAITELPLLAPCARSHHEWFDGSGYPDGLKGGDIPEAARIICIADSYDAMTSTRTYSAVKTQSEVRAEIERSSGTQFDPQIARIMLAMIDDDAEFHMNEQFGAQGVWKRKAELWSLAGKADGGSGGEEEDALPEGLHRIAELDVFAGLRYCATPETYLETLRAYADTAQENADAIESFWGSDDLKNATVKIHALKSTSKTIGATDLGALAERLEAAGKAGDRDMIAAHIGPLLSRYRQLGSQLSELLCPQTDESALEPISAEQLREAYDAIREFTEAFDFDSVAFTVNSLRAYRVPEEERERCEKLIRAVDNYDWDKIAEIL
ncbi:MAG: response regulator [Oscillospiraceae bacterium]|nr:response regulator [Oscillospiraceae bacterium]